MDFYQVNVACLSFTGMYFVDLSGYLCGNAWGGNGQEVMNVLLNGVIAIHFQLQTVTFPNCLTRSRSVLLNLNVGDSLRVNVPTGGWFYSDYQRLHAFTGFLVHI